LLDQRIGPVQRLPVIRRQQGQAQRFGRVLPQLANQSAPIERADLRYTNGFTLSWGTPVPAAPATPAQNTQDRT